MQIGEMPWEPFSAAANKQAPTKERRHWDRTVRNRRWHSQHTSLALDSQSPSRHHNTPGTGNSRNTVGHLLSKNNDIGASQTSTAPQATFAADQTGAAPCRLIGRAMPTAAAPSAPASCARPHCLAVALSLGTKSLSHGCPGFETFLYRIESGEACEPCDSCESCAQPATSAIMVIHIRWTRDRATLQQQQSGNAVDTCQRQLAKPASVASYSLSHSRQQPAPRAERIAGERESALGRPASTS
ncbi:hypothetical protein T440DRAFT_141929 [Plenodomus tracheiphilus IPT5]|uniref:Uncharacterized protein n=1 Tax=Plenodomus tracheiphilus IPT5 TaxID=1408161 RepID=A0A6A7B2P7_9PLEO|nr:hypothetical protein T440DRAFT_141929 [Plenodomus tracheiphilus IPT5]